MATANGPEAHRPSNDGGRAARARRTRVGRRVAIALVLVIVALIAVVGFNTWRFRSVQLAVPAVPPLPLDEALLAQHLSAAIKFRTVSRMVEDEPEKLMELQKLRAYLKQTFPRVFAALDHEIVGEASLLFHWRGSKPELRPILLMGHMDVVPGELPFFSGSGWTHPAFSGDVADGFVWGRGAWDDKLAVLGLLEAAEHLLSENFEPCRSMYFAFGHDEEVLGLHGAAQIAALLRQRGVRFETALDEGLVVTEGIVPGVSGAAALIGVTEKGSVTVDLTVNSEGGHSSMPPKETAIGILVGAVERLEHHQMAISLPGAAGDMLKILGPEMPFGRRVMLANLWLFRPLVEYSLGQNPSSEATLRTTTAPTIISGGTKENVLPRTASATVNFRIRPGDSVAAVLQHVRDAVADPRVEIAMRPSPSEPAPEAAIGSAGYRVIETTIRQIFPDAVVAPGLLPGLTDSRHYLDLADNVYRFTPIRVGPTDLPRFHGINERIKVSDYADAVRFYRQLMINAQ